MAKSRNIVRRSSTTTEVGKESPVGGSAYKSYYADTPAGEGIELDFSTEVGSTTHRWEFHLTRKGGMDLLQSMATRLGVEIVEPAPAEEGVES